MRITALLVALSFGGIVTAQTNGTVDGSAQSYRHRGDEALEQGDFTAAIRNYSLSLESDRSDDVELQKKIATLHQWIREYGAAKELLGSVIARNPDDAEAVTTLQQLQIRRGLQMTGNVGEEEVDYTTRTYSAGAAYGGVDWLDLHAGFSQSSKLVYDRSDLWLEAYVFPSYRTYIRFGLRQKNYSYPSSTTAVPDNNAYARVPDFQLEFGHYYFKENHFSIEGEYFTPNFYWNNGLRANNYKIGGTIRNWIVRPVYAEVFAAVLHDPDPGSLIMDPATGSIAGFGYENMTLLGGAVGFESDRLSVDLKYVPDRDLDRSLNWSLFSRIRVNMNAFSMQYDFLYDTYPASTTNAFSSSQVHMLTGAVEPAAFLEMRVGVKMLLRDVTRVAPFISLRLKTGV